jgi:transposase
LGENPWQILLLGDCHERVVAARFGVAPSSVSNVSRRWRETGSVAPRKIGGDRRSQVIEARRDWLLELVADTPDLTLREIRAALSEVGVAVGHGTVWRFFDRHDISVKKKPRTPPSKTGRT